MYDKVEFERREVYMYSDLLVLIARLKGINKELNNNDIDIVINALINLINKEIQEKRKDLELSIEYLIEILNK